MSVYVGIDVHRKRSQVAVVAQDGKVQLNKNVVNGSEPFLRLIGDLPAGTPVAFEAAFGWSWLAELLEDYGFDAHLVHPLGYKAIASARLKNDKVDAAILAQLLRADLLPEAWLAPAKARQLRALLRHRISLVRLGTQLRNRIHAVAADHGYDRSASYRGGAGRGWLAELDLPPASREIITDCLAVTGRPGPADRPDRRGAARPRQGRSAGQGAPDAARGRGVHRAGHGGAAWSARDASTGQDHSGGSGIIEVNEQVTFAPFPCDRYPSAGHPLPDLPPHCRVPSRRSQ
jgi:transposase